jgi:hypothetical protein
MSKRVLSVAVLALVFTAGSSLAVADEAGKEASKVVDKYAKAVVQVEATLTISAEGPLADRLGGDREQKVNALGTIICESGLTVCSLMSIDPTAAMGTIDLPGGQGSVSFKGVLSDVKIVLSDGTEIEARVVLNDEDLDLAFIAPKDKLEKDVAGQIAAVDLEQAGKADRLDPVIRISRLDKDLSRELAVQIDRISAIVTKPRLIYLIGGARTGSPVFTTEGKVLGLMTFRKKAGGASSRGRTGTLNGVPVVLPAKDIKKIADQAREELAKKPTKAKDDKPEAKQPEKTDE